MNKLTDDEIFLGMRFSGYKDHHEDNEFIEVVHIDRLNDMPYVCVLKPSNQSWSFNISQLNNYKYIGTNYNIPQRGWLEANENAVFTEFLCGKNPFYGVIKGDYIIEGLDNVRHIVNNTEALRDLGIIHPQNTPKKEIKVDGYKYVLKSEII